jgi:AraC-like DNA-binding protein
MYLSFPTTPNQGRRTTLSQLVAQLPKPIHPLVGQTKPTTPLPENIICFQRVHTDELNRPRRGRALHHRHVLIVPLRGRATVCVDDGEIVLGPGRALVVQPYQFHHYRIPRPRPIQWLFVTFEYAAGIALHDLRNRPVAVDGPRTRLLTEFLAAYGEAASAGAATLLLALFLMQAPARGGGSHLQGAADPNASLVPNVHHFVQTRSMAAPKLRELAHEIGISESHLRTRFRKTCGVSIGKHLRRLRLERARGLLRMTSARVGEVAEQCGYGSLYSFSRAFQKAYGVAPTTFREAQRRGSDSQAARAARRSAG